MFNGGQVHCVTHADLDGLTAGAVVKQYYPDAYVIITNYGKQLHLNKFKPGDTVFVTDFSLSKEVFDILADKKIRIIWIDHHKSAIDDLQAQGWNCEGIRRTDYSGAALTWMYFNPDKTFEQAPDFIKLVNWYDLWQHDKDPRVRAFSYGSGLWDIRPGYVQGGKFWNAMFSSSYGDHMLGLVLKYGSDIQKYVETYQDALCKDLAYRVPLSTQNGMRTLLAMAIRPGNSSTFERQDVTGVDALFTCQYVAGDVQKYRCGVYSPDNVKEILDVALGFGGGGHPTAAGFTFPRFPIAYPQRTKPMPLHDAVKMYDDIYRMRLASPIITKYSDRSNSISAKIYGWHSELEGFKVMVFNHHYIPEMLPIIPMSTECINPEDGTVADLYIGYVMTNSGLFRCCAYPSSTSVDMTHVLAVLQNKHMKDIDEDCYKYTLINGGIWWYQPNEPVAIPINLNIQSSSAN